MAKRLGRPDEEDEDVVEAAPYGPISNPVDKFAHLPVPTRRYIESLREADIEDLIACVQIYHRAKIIGRFGKWVLLTILAGLIAGAQIGEAIQKLFTWIIPGGPR